MKTTVESTETKLNQIPSGFRLFAKEELEKEIKKHNPLLALDPDKTYVNIAQGTTISSETLTEALLKRSIGETTFLSNTLAGLYSHAGSINRENQITGLNPADVKNIIDRLSTTLVNTYRQQEDSFWKLEEIATPLKLQSNPVNNLLKALAENSSLIEKAYQLDAMYPNLKQVVVSYFSKKLKDLYKKDIHPDTVCILLFNKGAEDSQQPFLTPDLTNFALNYFLSWFYSICLPDKTTILVKIGQDTKNLKLDEIFQENDILMIKSSYQKKLELFWQKNFNNYRVLARFSFLRTLFEQQSSTYKLSKKGFELACQASLGFNREEINALAIDPQEIPLHILSLLTPNQIDACSLIPSSIQASLFLINNQISTDILRIRDLETNDLLLYIPGYTPSFIEAKDEQTLINWIFHQAELSPDNFAAIASHFPHSSRMVTNLKLDAFLYQDYVKQEGSVLPLIAQEDIFSFITKRQKARVAADLYADGIPFPLYSNSVPNYQSTDSAFFTTIAAAIEYLPHLLPNIHGTASDLHELFPSPSQTASELIKKGIKEKLGLDIDPDKTFIRFSFPKVEPVLFHLTRTYLTSGREASSIVESLTMAALNNYQTASSNCTIIIYQDPSGKGEYTSSDQLLNISAKDIEEIIEQADLDTLHKSTLTAFWSAHADRVKYFIKHRYLQQALEQYHNKTLSEENFKLVSDAAFCALALEEGELPGLINPNIYIEIISINNYQSTDMFVFRDTSKQKVILYIAGDKQAFYPFATYAECICFLEDNAKKDVTWQKLLSSHFSMDVQDSVISNLQQGSYLFILSLGAASSLRTVDCSFENSRIQHPITTKPIEKSFFEVMQKNIQERSYLDANIMIISDKELMLKHFFNIIKSIEIALLLPSIAFPILNWATLAALATETSLNLYIAKNGDTVQERHQAAKDAGVNIAEFLLLGAFLSFRSLKFSKNQNLSESAMQDQVVSRPIIGGAGGRGLSAGLQKNPVSEEIFFGTTKPMRVWNIEASNHRFNPNAKVWFIDDEFLLFTGKTNKANHLIISSHGGYFPASGIVKVPGNTELVVLGPHGSDLIDPTTSNIARKVVLPYGIINESSALPTQTAFLPSLFSRSSNTYVYPKIIDVKTLAGTNTPGHIKNYSLAKYQGFKAGQENYLDLAHIVSRSRNPFPSIHELGLKPIDILTIRNRFAGIFPPSLKDVFQALENSGIYYDRITLAFCRSNIFSSMFNLAPSYVPATLYIR